MAAPKRYYVVNPRGCVHEVSKEHAAQRLSQAGWRMANKAEVDAYNKADVQRFDQPIGKPFSTDPDAILAEEEAEEAAAPKK